MKTTVERISRGTSPVTMSLLTDWLRVDEDDESSEMMQMVIDNATDICQEYTGRSLTECEYRKRFKGDIDFNNMVLPYPYIDEVSSLVWVNYYDTESEITDYTIDVEGNLYIINAPYIINPERIVCEYSTTPIENSSINMAILRVAAFLYERRGDCDADNVIKLSGAESMLAPYRRVLL